MKSLLSLLTLVLPLASFAGNGSGGVGPRPGMGMMTANGPEIVFNMGEMDGTVRFAHGQLVGNQWQIQKMEIPKADLLNQQEVVKALVESLRDNQWVEIK